MGKAYLNPKNCCFSKFFTLFRFLKKHERRFFSLSASRDGSLHIHSNLHKDFCAAHPLFPALHFTGWLSLSNYKGLQPIKRCFSATRLGWAGGCQCLFTAGHNSTKHSKFHSNNKYKAIKVIHWPVWHNNLLICNFSPNAHWTWLQKYESTIPFPCYSSVEVERVLQKIVHTGFAHMMNRSGLEPWALSTTLPATCVWSTEWSAGSYCI